MTRRRAAAMRPSRPYLNKITAQLDWRGTARCTKKPAVSDVPPPLQPERSPSRFSLRSLSARDCDFQLPGQASPSAESAVIFQSQFARDRPLFLAGPLSPRDGSRAALFCGSSNFARPDSHTVSFPPLLPPTPHFFLFRGITISAPFRGDLSETANVRSRAPPQRSEPLLAGLRERKGNNNTY